MPKIIYKLLLTVYWLAAAIPGASASENIHDLTIPINLFAACTVENDGTFGFGVAKNAVEQAILQGRYERAQISCMSFIHGVAASTSYGGNAAFCLPTVSLTDMKAAVVLTLKQKYQEAQNSVPLVIEALTKNWPCK